EQFGPSSADTAAGFRHAYSCTNRSPYTTPYRSSAGDASHDCTYADNGTYTVKARIIDKDGGFSEYTTNVVVTNVAPSLSPPVDDNARADERRVGKECDQLGSSRDETTDGYH